MREVGAKNEDRVLMLIDPIAEIEINTEQEEVVSAAVIEVMIVVAVTEVGNDIEVVEVDLVVGNGALEE